MAKRRFTVVLVPDEDGYQVVIPHYPEINTWGQDPNDAFEKAKELLEDALEHEEEGEVLPPVSPAPHVVVGEIEAEVPERLIEATEEWLAEDTKVRT